MESYGRGVCTVEGVDRLVIMMMTNIKYMAVDNESRTQYSENNLAIWMNLTQKGAKSETTTAPHGSLVVNYSKAIRFH